MRHILVALASVIGAALVSGLSGVACMEAGLNQNQHTPGNEDNGVALHYGEIAIDPTGRYVIYGAGRGLQVNDLQTGRRDTLDAVTDPQRVSFGPVGSGLVYVVGTRDQTEVVSAVVLKTLSVRWSRPTRITGHVAGAGFSLVPWIDSTPDGQFVVLTDTRRVNVVNTADGRLKHSLTLERSVWDVNVTPDSTRVLVTELHAWEGNAPTTNIHSLELAGGAVTRISVPNCASELVVTPDAHHAFVAPTNCTKDPVSLIDLDRNEFVRNLPGFGPVAVAPGGDLAVAFIDATRIETALFDDPSKIPSLEDGRYHLMLIDTKTLAFDTVPIGETLPRYAMTPDGRVLLVDAPSWIATGRVRLLDVAARRLVDLDGTTDVRLESFVVTSDAARVYLLDNGLYRVNVADARLTFIELPFVPLNINITADDAFLILREGDSLLWIFDVARQALVARLM